ncbi:MAG: cobalt ECF transporter T component CbiQ [Nitrospirota bacterium]
MKFDKEYFNIGRLDLLSYQDTPVHRLDPRAKVITTLIFILAVVSFPKYEIAALIPFFLFPVLLISFGDLPVGFLIKKILIVSPFAVLTGMFNPLFDENSISFFTLTFSAGWISFASILLKYTLTISAALVLIATTSFPGMCHALRKLGLPSLFVSQLLFLYRYLFVLMEETMKIVRAHDMRSFGKQRMQSHTAARIIGSLFLRTVERAERIYSAMLSRGFQGDVLSLRQERIHSTDILFAISTIIVIGLFRWHSLPVMLGTLIQGAML